MLPNDRKWKELNEQLMKQAQNLEWGLYTITRFDMAELLRKEKKLENALASYLEVCFLDLNGPSNHAAQASPELLRDHPAFDPSLGYLAPGVIKRIKVIMKKLDIDKGRVKDIFFAHNEKIGSSLKLPETPEACWPKLEKEL